MKLIVVDKYSFFDHNSEPCGNFWTILRHKLPIIHPDLPIPSNNPNSSVQPEFLNPIFLYKPEKSSRVLTAERTLTVRENLGLCNLNRGLIVQHTITVCQKFGLCYRRRRRRRRSITLEKTKPRPLVGEKTKYQTVLNRMLYVFWFLLYCPNSLEQIPNRPPQAS